MTTKTKMQIWRWDSWDVIGIWAKIQNRGFIVVQKCAAKDHSTQLVGIADPLGNLPFGLVHCLSALSFNNFKFCNVGRWSTASRNRSATRRLLLYLVDSIFSFRAWHTRTLGETIDIRPLA
uniref:Uncharacterized protein n=1 Tax=Solanum tuberosum TaxID=4113 RepID=M1DI91_SOLTU